MFSRSLSYYTFGRSFPSDSQSELPSLKRSLSHYYSVIFSIYYFSYRLRMLRMGLRYFTLLAWLIDFSVPCKETSSFGRASCGCD